MARPDHPPHDGVAASRSGVAGAGSEATWSGTAGAAAAMERGGAGRKGPCSGAKEDCAAFDDPLYATDEFRVNCFK
jgi:hypothetical protein